MNEQPTYDQLEERLKKCSLMRFLDRISPSQCRVVAIEGGKEVKTSELARRSGLHESTIKALTRRDTWYGVDTSTICRYTYACRVDLTNVKYKLQRLRRMLNSKRGPIQFRSHQRKYWSSVMSGEKSWRQKPE